MTTLLIFDTTAAACSAAVWRDGSIAAASYEAMSRGQAEHLLPMINATLADAGIAHADVDALGVTRGPGTFTGLRIGLAAARGLALVHRIPALGVTTFEAMAVRVDGASIVAVDTKRRNYYCQRFDPACWPTGGPVIFSAGQILEELTDQPLPLITDAPEAFSATPDECRVTSLAGPPNAAIFAPLVAERFAALAPGAQAPSPAPLYLRAPEAKLPNRRR